MLNNIQKTTGEMVLALRRISRDDSYIALVCVLVAAVVLTMERFGLQTTVGPHHPLYKTLLASFYHDVIVTKQAFWTQVHFSASSVLLFILLPLAAYRLFPLADKPIAGLRLANSKQHLWLYIILLLIMIPVVWLVCGDPLFNTFYPMYNPPTLRDWLLYESVYLVQFIAVEYFFRGFMLFSLEKRIGALAVLVMILPYSFIHLHKPYPEALGSIAAGLILGGLAIKSRSIWPGVVVHCGVAFSADFFSLVRSGRFMKFFN